MLLLWATLALVVVSSALGAVAVLLVRRRVRMRGPAVTVGAITERIAAVGKLVALEVCAKEIATATAGWAWLPPILLSQARLAMIFHFEKRYSCDLSRLRDGDVRALPGGGYRVTLPPVEGALRLIEVTPYDIQNARILGLLDVIPMTAERQRTLMARAQEQAAALFTDSDARFLAQARASVERQIRSLLALFGIEVEVAWQGEESPGPCGGDRPQPAARPEPEELPDGVPVLA